MTRRPLLVVGAGPSGLGCAAALAAQQPVELIDRIPVAGGEWGWQTPDVENLVRSAKNAGVRFRLGSSACRWDAGQLLLAAPGHIRWVTGAHLFFAGGIRPATAAELWMLGDRPAGILPATVAVHLLEAGVPLWRRPVVVGPGPWATRVTALISALGGRVTTIDLPAVGLPSSSRLGCGIRVIGRSRVQAIFVPSPDGPREIACDAVILAAHPRPVRNLDGALADDAAGVTYAQPLTGHNVTERSKAGREIAQEWLRLNGGTP